MPKVQYDSFYKFLVSIGTILIILPFAIIYFFFSKNNYFFVSQADFNALTDFAKGLMTWEQVLIGRLINILPAVSVALFAAGIAILSFGSYRWLKIQQKLDRKQDMENEQLELEIEKEKMSLNDIIAKAKNKAAGPLARLYQLPIFKSQDKGAPLNFQVSDVHPASKTEDKAVESFWAGTDADDPEILRILSIEYQLSGIIKRKFGSLFTFDSNIRLNGEEYDLIGVSKDRFRSDAVFEIEYYTDTDTFLSDSTKSLQALLLKTLYYSDMTKRSAVCRLIAVVQDNVNIDMEMNGREAVVIVSESNLESLEIPQLQRA